MVGKSQEGNPHSLELLGVVVQELACKAAVAAVLGAVEVVVVLVGSRVAREVVVFWEHDLEEARFGDDDDASAGIHSRSSW